MKFAYICGPVTGIPDDNRPAFEAARLVVAGILDARVTIPHDLVTASMTEGRAMCVCLWEIARLAERPDGEFTMVCLPGWRESLGTAVEVALARKLRVPVVELIGGELREL